MNLPASSSIALAARLPAESQQAKNEFSTVEVIEKGSSFKISVRNARRGRRFTITFREDVIASTVEAIKFAHIELPRVELIAPDWVKAELHRLGHRL